MQSLFQNPLFLIPTLTGLLFVCLGVLTKKFPPKEINALYGYRTKSSMKNKERWDFAQRYSAIEMIKLGVLLSLIGLIGLLYNPGEIIGLILGLSFLLIIVIILFLKVENAIKNKFHDE